MLLNESCLRVVVRPRKFACSPYQKSIRIVYELTCRERAESPYTVGTVCSYKHFGWRDRKINDAIDVAAKVGKDDWPIRQDKAVLRRRHVDNTPFHIVDVLSQPFVVEDLDDHIDLDFG